jgi:hypothetical protein
MHGNFLLACPRNSGYMSSQPCLDLPHLCWSITFVKVACMHLLYTKHQLLHQEDVHEYVLDLLHSDTSSEHLPLHVKKIRPHQRKTLIVDQLLHHVQTEETDYINLFSQPDHVPSKHELPLSYMVTILTMLSVPLMHMFSRCPSPALVV